MWFNENEDASFWASVFTELKNRGVEEILIAVTDGLKGMTEALATVFPDTPHQTCIVHLIRNSMAFINWKDMKGVTRALKSIYLAPTAGELEKFKQSAYGQRYPNIGGDLGLCLGAGSSIFQFWSRSTSSDLYDQLH